MKRFSLFALCITIIVGCATQRPNLALSVDDSVVQPGVHDDQFATSITITSATQHPPGDERKSVLLRSLVDKRTRAISHQLYVADNHSGQWRGWQRANGEGGDQLVFVSVLRKAVGCSAYSCRLNEHFSALIPDSTLREHPEGYAVKFYAQNGETLIVPVSGAVIMAQLATVDSIVAARK